MKATKIRQHNSFCAGAAAMREETLKVLTPILDEKGIAQMGQLLRNILKNERFVRVGPRQSTALRNMQKRRKK